jgi:CxxC motif-containing protein (DUF1111 family)
MASLKRRLSRLPFITVFLTLLVAVPLVLAAVDAPTGYDNLTNGFETQANFDQDRGTFDKVEQIADGLGPVYNAQACRECHQNPVSGSVTQVNEVRAGQTDADGNFTPHPGGTLVNDRAIDPAIQEHVFDSDNTVTTRTSLSIMGDGFVEAIPDQAFYDIQNAQPADQKGVIVTVPVLETGLDGTHPIQRIARFGWKNQHASLISFAADAYRNEIGITNPLFLTENSSNGHSVMPYDTVSDPEDQGSTNHPFGKDVEAFASFMRSTKAPPRSPAAATAGPNDPITVGEAVFDRIGCVTCHTDKITTAPSGTTFNGGFFTVNGALGSLDIHPYGDFMLHEIGTASHPGDGIPQASATAAQIRTAPLWGLRTRTRLMHDGLSFTITDAVSRHKGQATSSASAFASLNASDSSAIMAFLNSL